MEFHVIISECQIIKDYMNFFFEILINKSGDKYEKVNIFTKAKNWKLAQ